MKLNVKITNDRKHFLPENYPLKYYIQYYKTHKTSRKVV